MWAVGAAVGLCWIGLAFTASAKGKQEAPWIFPSAALDQVGRWVESGVRLERSPSGVLSWSEQRFPRGGEAKGIALPAHLGGGYLFYQPVAHENSSGTALWRARSWTSSLKPLSTLPFSASEIVPGFDRIYALSGGRQIALDPTSGQWLPLDPLPPVPTVERLKFLGSNVGALQAPIVGVLHTTDGGRTWSPLQETERLTDHPGLVVETDCVKGTDCSPLLSLSRTGNLVPVEPQGSFSSRPTTTHEVGRLAREILLRGVKLQDTVAALIEGQLVTLDRKGRVDAKNVAVPFGLRCQGLRHAHVDSNGTATTWFLCADADPRFGPELGTRIYTLRNGDLSLIFASQGRARFLAAGPSGLLLQGPCPRRDASLCLVTRKGARAITDESAATKTQERVFVVGKTGEEGGGAAVWRLRRMVEAASEEDEAPEKGRIEVQRLRPPGPKKVFLFPEGKELRRLLGNGTWLTNGQRMSVGEQGGFGFWVIRGSEVAGVFVTDEGTVHVGPIQRPLRRIFLSGRRGLMWGAAGFAKETTNFGQTWSELSFPYKSGDPDPNLVLEEASALTMGCSSAGCVVGRFLRVGWGAPEGANPEEPKMADTIVIPPPGGGRHRYSCRSEGSVSAPAIEGKRSRGRGRRRGEVESELHPFWELAPPDLDPLEVGYSVRDGRRLAQLDVWGKEQGSWARTGRARIAFRDPFEIDGVARSAKSAGLFSSNLEVQEALGILDRSTRFASAELDPSGDAGVFLVRNRAGTGLFSFVEGKAVQLHEGAEEQGIRGLSGAVLSKGHVYVGFISRDTFSVARLAPSGIEIVVELPLFDSGNRGAQVVRTTSQDLGVLIEADQGLMLYSLSEDGALGQPVLVPHRGSRPDSCDPEANGYFFERELPLTPYLEDAKGDLNLNRVRVRMIAGYGPPCLEAMAAETRGALRVEGGAAQPNAVPLVVTDVTSDGRRQLLMCH